MKKRFMTSYSPVPVAGHSPRSACPLGSLLSIARQSRVPLLLTTRTINGILIWIAQLRVGIIMPLLYGCDTLSTKHSSMQVLGDG